MISSLKKPGELLSQANLNSTAYNGRVSEAE